VQFLVHGFTYTNQYWSPPIEEFRNYSYSAFSCDRGLSSLAIDWVGVGLSSRPVNASDVQYATEAAVASQLARHLKNVSILPGVEPFKKVIGIGHSAGSVLLNFDALAEGPQSPFDGLIMKGTLTHVRSAYCKNLRVRRSVIFEPDSAISGMLKSGFSLHQSFDILIAAFRRFFAFSRCR
jgi:alpha-beta hydrolase superfamily lysophospholipase